MKPQHAHSVILFPLLAGSAALHTLYLLFASPRNPVSDHAGFLIWWGCLALTYGVLSLLLRRPRSMQTVILTAAGGFCLQLALTLITALSPSTVLAWSILLFMWISMYARCCIQLLEGTQPESVTTTFELSVLMLFAAAFGVSLSVMTPASLLHPIAGTLLALIAMARSRSGHVRADTQMQSSHWRGKLLLTGLLAATGCAAAAFCILLTGSASRLLSLFTQWMFSFLRAAAKAFDRILRWILSLLPEQHMNQALLEEAVAQAPGEAAEWGTFDSLLLFYLMLGVITVFVLIALIWVWRNGGFHRIAFRSRTVSRATRSRRSLRQLLQQCLQRLRRWCSFRVSCLKLRNTAPGLFVWLERQMRVRHLERQPGETAHAFLLRTQKALPSCTEILVRLADCLDQHYFGAGQTLSAAEISAMRRQLRAEFHQQSSEKTADR